jgi:hypothetical protein
MIKKWFAVILGVFLVGGFGWLLSQQNPEDAKFANVMRGYLDAYWKFYPTAGTLAGYYRYNDKLEDFEESNVEKYLSGVDKVNAEVVNKIAKDKLSPEVQTDLDIFRDSLELGMFQLEKIVPQQFNPIMYNDIILESLRGLLIKEFAALDARLRFATERLKALPNFLKQAKENLKTPPKEYTEEAIRQFSGILDFYKIEIPKLVESAGPEAKAKFQAEYAKVIPTLDDYQRFLQNDLLNKSTGNFRLGQEGHQRILQLTIGGTLMLNEIGGRVKADTTNLRNEMFKACFAYYKIMDPKFDIEHPPSNLTGDGLINNVVSHIINKIKSAQPTKEEWFAKIKTTAEDVKAFIDKTNLLTVPAEMPAIEPMPALGRDVILAKLITPSPYEPSGSYTVRINPYPENLPADQAQSFMDEYTNFMIPIWTIQHVYPGCFVPAAAMHLNATLIRKLHPNPALLKGWPLYAQDMFIYAGYNDYDLRQRLMELKLKLQALMDFQIDVSVHEGTITTKESAIRLMMSTGFQTQAEAERKWNQIVLHPAAAAYAYIGYQEILDMEKDYKAAKGDQFSQKEFLNKLTSFGPLPLRILKTKILQ